MKTITEKAYLFMIAMALFGGLLTQAQAVSNEEDAYGVSVKTYYFNGMNTSSREAEAERRALKNAVKNSGYKRYARNFNPILIYTASSGTLIDGGEVVLRKYETDLRAFESGNYCNKKRRAHCHWANAAQYRYYQIKKYFADQSRTYALAPGKLPPMKPKTQIISYSRGNIIANVLQENMIDGSEAKRTSIASADNHDYGNLFTMESDWVIATFTSRERNLKPQYYSVLSNHYQNLFDNGNYQSGKWGWIKALNKYIFQEVAGLPSSEAKSAMEGHNLEICYLNKRFGLYNDIVYDVVLNYYLLGGK